MAAPLEETIPVVRQTLLSLAQCGRTVTYRDLAHLAEIPSPGAIETVTQALEALIREDHAAGRPLLASLVVSRSAQGIPGRGFFQLCRELELYTGPDSGPRAEAYHAEELEMAKVFWRCG